MARPRTFCTIDGCDEVHYGRGYCAAHYGRFKNHGDPFGRRIYDRRDPSERFWEKVSKAGDCWIWTGTKKPNGYGSFQEGGKGSKTVLAHRWAFMEANGYLPQVVMHDCDTPACVNPAHLKPGTYKKNTQDMIAKGRRAKVRALGDRNVNTKLSPEKVREIRRLTELPAREVGRRYGVGHKTILAIWRGITWRHVD